MFKDLWQNNKKIIIIGLVLILFILIGIYIFPSSKENNEVIQQEKIENKEIDRIVLFGSNTITIKKGDSYIEPGYYAVTKDGEIKQEEVEVTGSEFNTNEVGTYYISYTIGNKKEQRKIIIEDTKEDKQEEIIESDGVITLTLKGESMMVLNIGQEYKEPGYTAIDTKEGDITSKVKVKGRVDTGTEGTYEITYEVENSSLKKVTKTRKIVIKNDVINVSITGNATDYTNKNILLNIKVIGDNFNYVKYPDGTVSKNKNSSYEISKNGTYKFLIYDLDGKYIKKEIKVDKIDKTSPTGNCTATVKNGKTIIVVTGKDDLSGVNHYIYRGNGQESGNQIFQTYTFNKELSSVNVDIYDKVGNVSKIVCRVIKSNSDTPVNPTPTPSPEIIKNDYLEMHFIVSGYNDDAILIRSGKGTILIDSGRYNAYKKVVPYLKDLGVTTIDAIIGSHPHYNHIQAQAKVVENFTIKSSYYSVDLNTCPSKKYCESNDVLYIKDALKKYNIPMNVKNTGDIITIGDMTIYIIGPYKLNNTSKYMQNSNSFIFILKYKNNTFMFTGDADTGTFNYRQLKPYADKLGISLDIDMLKYPHHGNAGLDNDLLNAMTPKYVIIPNYNYTKYPISSNRSKLTKIGASIYENGKDGNIVLTSDGNNITIKKNQLASSYKR